MLGPGDDDRRERRQLRVVGAGIRAIGGRRAAAGPRGRAEAAVAATWSTGWRFILGNPALRPLFANTLLVNALIMAPAPLLAC